MEPLTFGDVEFSWQLLVGPGQQVQLRLWDRDGLEWPAVILDRAGDEPERRLCDHVRAVRATHPEHPAVRVGGTARVRDGVVTTVDDDLDSWAWHLAGGCMPCVMDERRLYGAERTRFLELLAPSLHPSCSREEWDALVVQCTDTAIRSHQ